MSYAAPLAEHKDLPDVLIDADKFVRDIIKREHAQRGDARQLEDSNATT